MEWFIPLFILFFLCIVATPFMIAAWAYKSRQRKRDRIPLPPGILYLAPVRLNSTRMHGKVMKLKGFEYSGYLYVTPDNKVCIRGTAGQYSEYDLATCLVEWPGMNLQNGLLDWMSVGNNPSDKTYVNAETGLLVFRTSSKLPRTEDVFMTLRQMQDHLRGGYYRPV